MLTNSIIGDIKHNFRYGNMVTRLIFVNFAVFLFFGFFNLLSFFGQSYAWYEILLQKLEVPASASVLLHQPWSVFTYMFLHEGFWHILFNMLWLYWFGEIFVLYLNDKKVLPVYILGGLTGALIYILSFNFIPVFKPLTGASFMLGASASIFAIVFAAATINPNHIVNLILIGPVRLVYVAIIPLLIDVLNIPNGNAGGYIAHVGGALSGILYIKALQNGTDLAAPFIRLFDMIANLFRPKQGVRVSYKNVATPNAPKNRSKNEQEKVDEILDKIARSGYDSLTKEEKDFLFNYSKK